MQKLYLLFSVSNHDLNVILHRAAILIDLRTVCLNMLSFLLNISVFMKTHTFLLNFYSYFIFTLLLLTCYNLLTGFFGQNAQCFLDVESRLTNRKQL